jgi:DNA-binding CsgD family transcriptional regulator
VQAESEALDATAEELSQDYLAGEMQRHPSGLIEVITGADQIYRTALDLWHTAKDEILIFDKPPYAAEQADADYDQVDNERPLLERGVRLRGIYQRNVLETAGHMRIATRLAGLGEQARVLPELPIKLHIYDRRVAMVPLTTDTNAGQSRAIVHPSGLLNALIALFEAYWERAHPVFDGTTTLSAHPDFSGEEEAVLRMLAAGMKDQAIARQLGVSRRTAARRTERILELLDASSRFQAGAQAARRGWI